MSMYGPAVSSRSSTARGPRPLSMTWVRPPSRGGSPRSRSNSLIELLQLLRRLCLDVVEQRIAVRVDADPQRPEVLDTELPEALGHELLPGHLLDLLDLRRLQRGRPADDREVDHPVAAHRLDRLVREAPLPADRADAVVAAERLRETHHACRRRRPYAHRLVPAGAELADIGRRVEQERAVQVPRWIDALVEDAHLRAVANADDVTVDGDEIARPELADLLLGRRKGQPVLSHTTTLPRNKLLQAPSGVPLVLDDAFAGDVRARPARGP